MFETLLALFVTIGVQEGVDPKLLAAVCWEESHYNTNAINREDGDGDSVGVCQIKVSTARWLGYRGSVRDLWRNPRTNAKFAARYLKYQLQRYRGDRQRAVSAYNLGHFRRAIGRHGAVNQAYVDRVLKRCGGK